MKYFLLLEVQKAKNDPNNTKQYLDKFSNKASIQEPYNYSIWTILWFLLEFKFEYDARH